MIKMKQENSNVSNSGKKERKESVNSVNKKERKNSINSVNSNNNKRSSKNSKNLNQEISIYCNALEEKLFNGNSENNEEKTLIIELGCGAGGLSKTFQLCNNNENNLSYLLIDRMKYRAKNRYDNFIKSKLTKGILTREVIDIKDLSLTNYINSYDNFIFISKHLGGEAYEISINKIINIINERKILKHEKFDERRQNNQKFQEIFFREI